MFVLVLFIILLLVFAIYYGILSRYLEKKWKEKFAQNPAVLGLFDPAKPPPYLHFDPTIPNTVALAKFGVWSRRWQLQRAQFVQFNFTLPPRTIVGVYLRQYTVPTIVQYNFFDQVASKDYPATSPAFTGPFYRRHRRHVGRHKRHLLRLRRATGGSLGASSDLTNEQLILYLQPGLWFLSLVNDQPSPRRLNLTVYEATNNQKGCRNQCSHRGSCEKNGTCKCFARFTGDDCSFRETVKVCNGHGHYVRGRCKCFPEWKGRECETLWTECLDPTCSSNGHCVQGVCKCYPGYDGARCENMVCLSPNCSGNGICQGGRCRCFQGFSGPSCEMRVDWPQPSKLVCSGRGSWDGNAKSCRCQRGYTGPKCDKTVCALPCLHGECVAGKCQCAAGWEGAQCDRKKCDPRCYEHGKCYNGTCSCNKGWNGKHCSLDGCPNGCSNHGNCMRLSTGWHCQCTNEWKGEACEYPREMKCSDRLDNDGDKLIDCADPDCCLDPYCVSGGDQESARESCSMATNPTVVLLSKKTVKPTYSFWDRIKFLVEAESVQKGSNPKYLHPDLVSVVRGIVRLEDGSPLRGCRVMDKLNLEAGYTLSRADGHFDLVVNGGSLVKLSFARRPTQRFTADFRVFAPVNQFVHAGIFLIRDKSRVIKSLVNASRSCTVPTNTFNLLRPVLRTNWQASSFASCLDSRATVCRETGVLRQSVPLRGTNLRLVYTSTWASGHQSALWIGMTGPSIPKGLAEVHLVVSVAGQRETKQFEADPNLSFVFTWDKHDVYGQKVYGLVATTVEVGYLYKGCVNPVWEVKIAYLPGCDMSASDIGGWNLHIHHVYNWRYGIVYRGDGSHLYLPMQPWRLRPLIGDGHTPRDAACTTCSESLFIYKRVREPTALATDRMGNVYMMDGLQLRRINPAISEVVTIGHVKGKRSETAGSAEIGGEYYLAVNPTNDSIVVSDSVGRRLYMARTRNMGSRHSSLQLQRRKVTYPKGLVFDLNGDMYLADSRSIRVIYVNGSSEDVIGRSAQTLEPWRPLSCGQSVLARDMLLQWPTAMAFDARSRSLFFLDGTSVYRLHLATKLVSLVAGRPLNCPPVKDSELGGGEEAPLALNAVLKKPYDIAFAPTGDLYIAEHHAVRVLKSDGRLYAFAGDSDKSCRNACPILNFERLAKDVRFGIVRAIAVNVSGEVIIADPKSYRVHVAYPHSTVPKNGIHVVVSPDTREVYYFNQYGQHLQTMNALTNTVSHTFEYRVNDIIGWLKNVRSGNESTKQELKISRSIESVPLMLTTPQNLKYAPRLDSEKRLIGLMAPDSEMWRFEYNGKDLLIKVDGPGGLSSWFTYDEEKGNRLAEIILPSGFVQDSVTWSLKNSTGVSALQASSKGIGLTPRGGLSLDLPQSDTRVRFSLHKYPLQPGVYPMLNARLAQSGGLRHNATWAFVIDEKLQPAPITKELRVNGDLVYQVVYKPAIRGSRLASESYRARDGSTELFEITYSSTHQPLQVFMSKRLGLMETPVVELNYNRFGVLHKISMGRIAHQLDYDGKQRLARFTLSEGRRWSYNYKGSARKPNLVVYPSGAQYSLVFAANGNINHISSSTNHVHSFELATLIDQFRVFYWPWNRAAPNTPCRFDFSPSGRLTAFTYPGGYRRVHFLYTDNESDRLRLVLAGPLSVRPSYHPHTGLVTELVVRDAARNFGGVTSVAYMGTLPAQLRVAWSLPGVTLLDCHVKLHYDERFRVKIREASFGPRKFHSSLRTTYRETNSGVQYTLNEGQFEIDVEFKQTLIRHKGVTWKYEYDAQRRLKSSRLTNNGVESRTNIRYNSLNRIESLEHYVQSGASSSITKLEFSYDSDGRVQLIKDVGNGNKLIEQFNYLHNSRLKYLEQLGMTVPVKYDGRGLLRRFDHWFYKFDSDGFIESRRPVGSSAQSNSPKTEKFYFNAKGLLTEAEGPSYRLQYFYDAHDRLVIRTDLYKRRNTLQFFYNDLKNPRRVTHIINHFSSTLISFLYDPVRGSLYAMQEQDQIYYVHCDHEASPMVVYNRMGRVMWRVSYSSSGAPTARVKDIWLPLGYRGAFHDEALGFSWLDRRIYDTNSGHWMSPNWMDVFDRLKEVTVFPDAIDPFKFEAGLNRRHVLNPAELTSPDFWLSAWGLKADEWLPPVSADRGIVAGLSLDLPTFRYPARNWEASSAFACAFEANWRAFRSTKLFPEAQLTAPRAHWIYGEAAPGLFALSPMFGPNLTLTVDPSSRLVQVHGTAQELDREVTNQVLAINLFNNSFHVPWSFYAAEEGGIQHYFFVRDKYEDAEMDLFHFDITLVNAAKWRELATGVNVSVVRHGNRFVDVRLRKSRVQYNLRYGASLDAERKRLRRIVELRAEAAAWANEQSQAKLGRRTALVWSPPQTLKLARGLRVKGYHATPRPLASGPLRRDVDGDRVSEFSNDASLLQLLPQ